MHAHTHILNQNTLFMAHLTTPYTLHDIITTFFQNLPTFELISVAIETLAVPMAKLWDLMFLSSKTSPSNNTSPSNMQLRNKIVSTWSAVTTSLQASEHSPLPSSLLPSLTPLLVTTLSAEQQKIVDITLNFWALTFDRQEGLSYPPKLVDAFCKYAKTHHTPHELRLAGMGVILRTDRPEGHGTTLSDSDVTAVNETQTDDITSQVEPVSSESGTEPQNETQPYDEEEVIVLPDSSPMRGSHSPYKRCSFIGHTSPQRPYSPRKTHPLSPNVRALDKLLSRSPYRAVGKATSGEKVESVCRRLALMKDNSQTVSL